MHIPNAMSLRQACVERERERLTIHGVATTRLLTVSKIARLFCKLLHRRYIKKRVRTHLLHLYPIVRISRLSSNKLYDQTIRSRTLSFQEHQNICIHTSSPKHSTDRARAKSIYLRAFSCNTKRH